MSLKLTPLVFPVTGKLIPSGLSITGKLSFDASQRKTSEHRLGRVVVAETLLRDDWESLIPLFRELVIVDVQRRYDLRTVTYWAYCPSFEVISQDIAAPLYVPSLANICHGPNTPAQVVVVWTKSTETI